MSDVGDVPNPVPRVITTLMVLMSFIMSVLTFMNYGFYRDFRDFLSSTIDSTGIGFSTDILLLSLVFAVVLVGIVSERLLGLTLFSGGIMLLPALLYYSKIDWMYLLGLPIDFGSCDNALPEAYLLLNGVALLSGGLLLRSHRYLIGVRRVLAYRGASTDDLNRAMRGNFNFFLTLIGAAAAGALAIAALASLFTPAFGAVSAGEAYAYLVMGLVAAIVLLAVFGLHIWTARRSEQYYEDNENDLERFDVD